MFANFGDPSRRRHMPAIPTVSAHTEQEQLRTVERRHSVASSDQQHVEEEVGKVDVLVAGSLAVDLSCDYSPLAPDKTDITPALHTSNPAVIGQSFGGVGYNVALASNNVGSSVLFCSVVGDDLTGRAALSSVRKQGLSTEAIQVLPPSSGGRTAQYVAVNDAKRDLLVAMADMNIMESAEKDLNFESFWEPLVRRSRPQWMVADANWKTDVLAKWVRMGKKYGSRIAFEPVSTAKSRRLFGRGGGVGDNNAAIGPSDSVPNHSIDLAAPNRLELAAMHMAAGEAGLFDSSGWWRVIDAMGMAWSGCRERLVAMTSAALVNEGIPQQSIQLLPFIPCVVTKLGAQGVLLTQLLRPGDGRLTSGDSGEYILSRASTSDELVGGIYMRHFGPAEVMDEGDIVSVNGAGDALVGAVVSGLSREATTVEEVIPMGQEASVRRLRGQH